MKSQRYFLLMMLCLFLLISACGDKKDGGDYSGVSEMIADRNKARYDVAEKPSQKKATTQKRVVQDPSRQVSSKEEKTEKKLSSIELYEQEIVIVGKESEKKLAEGTAYINKKGQIVKIKINRN